jgi:peptidoglycan/xylan/chitin deacetylase (PgdA/CDA1 family)
MNGSALILTYHAIEDGAPPLCVDPGRFADHLDALTDAGAVVMTIGEVVESLRRGDLPKRAVALTFDDGFASVAEHAAPLLAERGLAATVFAVAGAVAGTNDWPSQPSGAPRRPLLGGPELLDLASTGIEIGSHGVQHTPLSLAGPDALRREIADSRDILEQLLQRPVRSFAYPYNELASAEGRQLVRATYAGACGGGMSIVGPGADPWRLPRVDAHYLRRPELLRRALMGSLDAYLRVRRVGARARRLVKKDFEREAA